MGLEFFCYEQDAIKTSFVSLLQAEFYTPFHTICMLRPQDQYIIQSYVKCHYKRDNFNKIPP